MNNPSDYHFMERAIQQVERGKNPFDWVIVQDGVAEKSNFVALRTNGVVFADT